MSIILQRLADWADADPSAVAQRFKQNGKLNDITAREFCDRVFHLALFLESKGFTPNDCGAILSYNCPQWVHMDLAPQMLGGKSAGLYPNSAPKDIDYILNHTEAKVLSVQNKTYFEKLHGKLPATTQLVIVFDNDTSFSPKAVAYEAALAEGRKLAKGKKLSDYLKRLDKDTGSFLIYTSGTTGAPKGALLSQDNLAFAADVAKKHWGLGDGKSVFSFLPLCHIAEKMQNIGVGISFRYTVTYATSFDNVATELAETQPTLLLCVPRLWEKMVEGVSAKIAAGKGLKKNMAVWALAVGARVAEAKYAGRSPGLLDSVQHLLADKLVLSKMRQALGLAHIEQAASGAAALSSSVSKWFRALGIEILEDFGQTESTGVILMTVPGRDCAGTVGIAPEGVEFKLAEDGEIVTRGRHVFKGYYKNEQATRETVSADGWLHTGDLGEFTKDGLVRIRGRKKEIMKSSGGKMVAPLPIEELLKESPLISQACMVGDGRKYFSVLLTLTKQYSPDIDHELKNHLESVNRSLGSFERIKYYRVVESEFSVEGGEMTPTMKMKRDVIERKYQHLIDQMYS